jgi:uncharacterized protein
MYPVWFSVPVIWYNLNKKQQDKEQNMKSPLEINLENEICRMLDGKTLEIAKYIFNDQEIKCYQDNANVVSIKRLGYNDHGPVHMRKTVLNAVKMFNIFVEAGIKPNLVKEEAGTADDSRIAVLLAAFLHDTGMTVGRENHEMISVILAAQLIDRILKDNMKSETARQVAIKSIALEGIMGHMTKYTVASLEAGIILIADGCDMEKGRARIPMLINQESKVGDIHKYSSSAIEKVTIEKGLEKPLKITIEMSASVGFFQVEEVLFGKIDASSVKQYIELYAFVTGRDVKKYL